MGGAAAEFVPVVAIVANEVGDFAEGLERDCVLEWHFNIRIEGMVDSGVDGDGEGRLLCDL